MIFSNLSNQQYQFISQLPKADQTTEHQFFKIANTVFHFYQRLCSQNKNIAQMEVDIPSFVITPIEDINESKSSLEIFMMQNLEIEEYTKWSKEKKQLLKKMNLMVFQHLWPMSEIHRL